MKTRQINDRGLPSDTLDPLSLSGTAHLIRVNAQIMDAQERTWEETAAEIRPEPAPIEGDNRYPEPARGISRRERKGSAINRAEHDRARADLPLIRDLSPLRSPSPLPSAPEGIEGATLAHPRPLMREPAIRETPPEIRPLRGGDTPDPLTIGEGIPVKRSPVWKSEAKEQRRQQKIRDRRGGSLSHRDRALLSRQLGVKAGGLPGGEREETRRDRRNLERGGGMDRIRRLPFGPVKAEKEETGKGKRGKGGK